MRIILILIACVLLGCDRSTPGPTTAHRVQPSRQPADPFVPEHPRRPELLGEWQSEGETVLVIERDTEGRVVIRSPQVPPWESVINNVRWLGDALRYDEYLYYTGPEDFTTINNPAGDHPYSGVRNDSTLMIQEDPDRLRHTISTKHTPDSIGGDLVRVGAGG